MSEFFGFSTHQCNLAACAIVMSLQMKLYMQLDCSSLSASYLVKGREPARAAGMPSGKASDRRGGGPLLFLLSVRSFFSLALLAVPQGGAASNSHA